MEEIKSARINSLIVLYDMQTTFFDNVLDGIADKDAHNRLDTQANHIAWLTGSLVQQRFELAKDLGVDMLPTANEFFKDNKGIQDGIAYPSLDVFKQDWQEITPVLKKALEEASDEKLDSAIEMPGMTMSLYDMITFCSYREANCIGQIALWRRLLGYSAMKYM